MGPQREGVVQDMWVGCYDDSWKGLIVPDAFAHPAKYSRALIQRLYQHAAAEGWVWPGATVLDPFGGPAGGGLDAALAGYRWVGIELEPRFCALGHGFDCGGDSDRHLSCANIHEHGPHHVTGNLELWQRRYGHLLHWIAPTLLQGDSRRLVDLLQGQVDCAVSSPPYGDNTVHDGCGIDLDKAYRQPGKHGQHADQGAYGTHPQQLGNTHGDTFWSAVREIVAQLFAVLRPGGTAIWVVKSYVRDGQLVDFPHQWQALCEACGFVTLHEHHALLTTHHGTQTNLLGPDVEHKTKRVSFFRRLHEAKGGPVIEHETVLCMRKPGTGSAAGIACSVSSPPYAVTPIAACEGNMSGQPGGRKASAFTDVNGNIKAVGYGASPGQLGSLPAGIPPAPDLVMSSPPYNLPMSQDHNGSKGGRRGTTPSERGAFVQYGTTPGQLEGMRPGSFDEALGTP
jgi:hypothetical protein